MLFWRYYLWRYFPVSNQERGLSVWEHDSLISRPDFVTLPSHSKNFFLGWDLLCFCTNIYAEMHIKCLLEQISCAQASHSLLTLCLICALAKLLLSDLFSAPKFFVWQSCWNILTTRMPNGVLTNKMIAQRALAHLQNASYGWLLFNRFYPLTVCTPFLLRFLQSCCLGLYLMQFP